MKMFNSITITHVYREANGVANRLAHIASCSGIDDFWLDEMLFIIENVLCEDICSCGRGSGSMSPSGCIFVIINK